MAHPLPLRTAILSARQTGQDTTACARAFGVSRSTVKRYVRQWRETGDLAAKPSPGRPPLIRPERHPRVVSLVTEQPGATLEQYCQLWREATGTLVSISTLARTLQRLGFQRRGAR